MVNPVKSQYFHVISRVVDRRLIFEDQEKSFFLSMIRNHEKFAGVEVLCHCLMGNHFHLIIRIPDKPGHIPEEEIWQRMSAIYSESDIRKFRRRIELYQASGNTRLIEDFYDSMRNRMYDISSFMKDIKMKFSKWYNRRHERKGTLWEERFKSILLQDDGAALRMVAAYVEMNPVRAGVVDSPEQYEWCSFADAVSGSHEAIYGIAHILGRRQEGISDPEKLLKDYRSLFAGRIEVYHGHVSTRENEGKIPDRVAEKTNKGSRLSPYPGFHVKVRELTEGGIIGSKKYVERFFSHSQHRQYVANPASHCFHIKGGSKKQKIFYSLRKPVAWKQRTCLQT